MKTFTFLVFLTFSFNSVDVSGQQISQTDGIPTIVHPAKTETTAALMERSKNYPIRNIKRPEREYPSRRNLPQNPLSKPFSSFPETVQSIFNPTVNELAQTPSTTFNGFTSDPNFGSFPPDDMGSVGPTQFILFINGKIRSFNKTTGVADGILDANPDAFFTSVMTPPVASNFTSDPRIRYDRFSGKWILMIIDVPGGAGTLANRVLIAISSTSTITGGTTWTFSQFLGQAGLFLDYETLGVDINAVYIGGNMFTLAGSFSNTNAYVISRTNLVAGGAYTVYGFTNLITGGGGPFTPQGVDNFNTSATEGYFIGVDAILFGKLMMRRVSTPAGVPTISVDIPVTVNATSSPQNVPHLGNTAVPASDGFLDALDDRLFAAMARNGHIWTAHNIFVGVSGTTASASRNGVRWYDIQNITATPSIFQSGTIFDNAASNPRWYGIPSVMVSGQNHAAFSLTTAGNTERSNAATTGRLTGDGLGTTQSNSLTTTSSSAYNPPGDPGNPSRRWGDYSYVSLDPLDDMTMWMVNQYCVGTDVYGCNVTKLLAPPPATPASCSPSSTPAGQASVNVIVTGTAVSGSGFYDPGANLSAPALPFNHISATVSGGVTVNSVTYTDPTHVTLNLNTVGSPSGAKNITVTNPDGQVLTGTGIFNISGIVPITLIGLKGRLNNNFTISLTWVTATENNNKGFFVERTETNDPGGWNNLGFINGAGTSVTNKNYSWLDNNIQLNKIYRYRLKQVDLDGNYSYSNEVVVRVKDLQRDQLLMTNYPNPFRSVSNIKYNLPYSGKVSLKIFDITGKEISTLVNSFQQYGFYAKEFDAYGLGSGIYFCKLSFDGETITNRIMLIR